MGSILIHNIGTLVTGDLKDPISEADSLYIENGRFVEIGTQKRTADTEIGRAHV